MVRIGIGVALCSLASALCSCAPSAVPEINIEVARGTDALTIKWTLTNNLRCPIWVPVNWGAEGDMIELPLAFVTPDGDIAFVFGSFEGGENRGQLQLIEYSDVSAKFKRIDPGHSISGQISITMPYALQSEVRNPYEARGLDLVETALKIDRAHGFYLAAQYLFYDPDGEDVTPGTKWDEARQRATTVKTMIVGEKLGPGIDRQFAEGIVTSRRIHETIPLAEPVTLHFIKWGTF